MASIRLEDEIERQLLCDTDSDCGTDEMYRFKMSITGSQSTSLANFLNHETKLSCVLFTWKEEKYPNKVHKMQRWLDSVR
jgi:hypothetical protein